MSRRKTFPSFNSSRQMMTAWKVSGLSHSPAIIASRPASMRLAIAISPSRERSSTVPISRRYIRTGSSVRSAGSFASDFAGVFGVASTSSPASVSSSSGSSRASSSSASASSVSTTLMPISLIIASMSSICSEVTSSDGITAVELLIGDVAALLGLLDHLLDGGVGKIEQRQRGVRGLGRPPSPAPRPLFAGRPWILIAYRLGASALACHVLLRQRPSQTASLPYALPTPGRSDGHPLPRYL